MPEVAYSSSAALPMITAPASRSLATWKASLRGRKPSKVWLPLVVAMSKVSNRFLIASGMPSTGERLPAARAASAARACSIASLATIS